MFDVGCCSGFVKQKQLDALMYVRLVSQGHDFVNWLFRVNGGKSRV